MRLLKDNEPILAQGVTSAVISSTALNIGKVLGYSIVGSGIDTTPTPKTFTSAIGNNIQSISHGFSTGLIGQFTTTGSLPTGLSTSTNYYIIYIDSNQYQVANSQANAIAGTPVVLSGTGAGSFNPTSSGVTATVYLQASNDNVNFYMVSNSSQNLTSSNIGFFWNNSDCHYKWVRLQCNVSVGQLTFNAFATVKDEEMFD